MEDKEPEERLVGKHIKRDMQATEVQYLHELAHKELDEWLAKHPTGACPLCGYCPYCGRLAEPDTNGHVVPLTADSSLYGRDSNTAWFGPTGAQITWNLMLED